MISIIPIFFVNNINSSCMFRRGWYNDSVSSGGGTVYTTDLKSVGASLTSSNLVWRIWIYLETRYNMEFVFYIMSFIAFVIMPIYGIIKLQKIESHLKGK